MIMRRRRGQLETDFNTQGFTLIELLVVISIIALLVGILLPALGAARSSAQAIVCGGNQRSVAQAVMSYTTDGKDLMPPSYVYPYDDKGSWRWRDQFGSGSNRYLHWSYMVYGNQSGGDDAFKCPSLDNGGMPRTFPGNEREDWQTAPNTNPDFQAPRMAYAGNSALMPRNKFNDATPRNNKLVSVAEVRNTSGTILAAEYSENTHLIRDGVTSKSHRPITALRAVGSGLQSHMQADSNYGRGSWFYDLDGTGEYGLIDYETLLNETSGALSGISSGGPNINAVGRHHGGGGGDTGSEGGANFVYTDGHVARSTIRETMDNREWGDRMYSVTGGDTAVYDYSR